MVIISYFLSSMIEFYSNSNKVITKKDGNSGAIVPLLPWKLRCNSTIVTMEILSSLMNGEYKGRKRLFEFFLDIFTEFMEFTDSILKISII